MDKVSISGPGCSLSWWFRFTFDHNCISHCYLLFIYILESAFHYLQSRIKHLVRCIYGTRFDDIIARCCTVMRIFKLNLFPVPVWYR